MKVKNIVYLAGIYYITYSVVDVNKYDKMYDSRSNCFWSFSKTTKFQIFVFENDSTTRRKLNVLMSLGRHTNAIQNQEDQTIWRHRSKGNVYYTAKTIKFRKFDLKIKIGTLVIWLKFYYTISFINVSMYAVLKLHGSSTA